MGLIQKVVIRSAEETILQRVESKKTTTLYDQYGRPNVRYGLREGEPLH
jgi:hypothetical protein